MDTLDRVITLFGCIIEIYLIFDYFNNFFSVRERWEKRQCVLLSAGACALLFLINSFENGYLNLIGVPILLWVFVTLMFKSKTGVRIGYFVIAYAVMIGVEFLHLIMARATVSLVSETGVLPLSEDAWQLVFVKFLNYIIFTVLKQTSGKAKHRLSNRMFAAYMCLPLCTIGCMLTIFYSGVDFSGNTWARLLMTVFFVCMLLGNILVFYAFQNYTEGLYKENEYRMEITHQKSEIQRLNQIAEMNDNYKEMVHNTSHYLKVIGEMAVEKQNEEIYNLVKNIDKSFEKKVITVYSNYRVLDALLAENASRAEKNGVVFDVYVEQGTDLSNISDMDMISMMGNLLDNAVTAAVGKGENSTVKVRIFMQNDGRICVVKIVNDFEGILLEQDGRLRSTKNDGGIHGIGMSSVNRTAEKYDGYLEYFVENEKFVSVLILPVTA